MLPVVTAQQMRAIDQWAIEEIGIPGIALMENAGKAIVKRLQEILPDITSKTVIIFCGKGNNGGDGFVIARHLHQSGTNTVVLLAGKLSDLKGDAKTNALSAINLKVPIQELTEKNINSFDHKLRHSDVIVDALFGTGLSKSAAGFMGAIIKKINQHKKFCVSVDINSGIDSDSGLLIGPHVISDLTFALDSMKISHLIYPAAGVIKKLEVLDIGIPFLKRQDTQIHLVEKKDIKKIFHTRQPDSHKGNYGHVLVLAGSRGKGGAAGLSALAALRSGCGLCTLALPDSCQKAFELHPMEVMTLPLPELLPHIKCPLILDADAINAFENNLNWLDNLKSVVFTPHPKELSRLTGLSTTEIQTNRIHITNEFAQKNSIILLLKGAPSLIATPDGNLYINSTGNPGMATGGSGDVLTGVIAGLAAQNIPLVEATIAGAYIHGYSGDIFAGNEGQTNEARRSH